MLQKMNICFDAMIVKSLATIGLATGIGLSFVICNPMLPQTFAQTEEVETMGTVNRLVQLLTADDISQRDAAEQAMTELPVEALDFIEVPAQDATTDFIERLTRARQALEKKAVEKTLKASLVTLEGKYTIRKVLQQLHAQTDNQVELPVDLEETIGDIEVELDIVDKSFWDVLNIVLAEGDLIVDPYGGDTGRMRLQSSSSEQKGDGKISDTPPSNTTGLLYVEADRMTSTRNFRNPLANYTTIDLLVRWEPRVTPISIELETASLKIIDEQQQEIPPTRKSNISTIVQPEIPELNFPIVTALIPRDVKQLDSIKGKINATLPGRRETFTFRDLGELKPGVEQTKSGATVTWHGYRKNESLFAVTVELSFDSETNRLDSHLGWAYDNEVLLVRDGESFESVASESISQQGQQLKVLYLFEEDPALCELVYKTPAAIVKVSLDFELKNIKVP